jgi:hypothetical protein
MYSDFGFSVGGLVEANACPFPGEEASWGDGEAARRFLLLLRFVFAVGDETDGSASAAAGAAVTAKDPLNVVEVVMFLAATGTTDGSAATPIEEEEPLLISLLAAEFADPPAGWV